MASDVSICSNALLMLGADPIASFTEGGKGARLASNLFPDQKRDFLRMHPWNAAMRRVRLAPEATPPAFGFKAQFLLPANCLRVIGIETGSYAPEFKVEGRRLLADATVLDLQYLEDIPADQFDANMAQAMTYRMAAAMAYAMTASASLAQSMAQEADMVIRRAKAADGQEGTTDTFMDDNYSAARFAGGGWVHG